MNKSAEWAILVFSCDKYRDLWEPLFANFRRCWPDCPFVIYLLANHAEYHGWDRVKTIAVGKDVTWSNNALEALNIIKEPYLLTMFDDLFFKEQIETAKILSLTREFVDCRMNYLRLNPTPPPEWTFSA